MALFVWKVHWGVMLALLLSWLLGLITGNSCVNDLPDVKVLLGLQNYDSYKGFLPDSISDWRSNLEEEAFRKAPNAPKFFVKDEDSCRWFFILDRHLDTLTLCITEMKRRRKPRQHTELMRKDRIWAIRLDYPAKLYFSLHTKVKGIRPATFQFYHRIFCGTRRYESKYKKKLRLVKWVIDPYKFENGRAENGDGVIVAGYAEEKDKLELAYVLHIGWDTLLIEYANRIRQNSFVVPESLFKMYTYEDEGWGRVWKEFRDEPIWWGKDSLEKVNMVQDKHGRSEGKRILQTGPLKPAKKIRLEDRKEEEEAHKDVVSQLSAAASSTQEANVRPAHCEDGERDIRECKQLGEFCNTLKKFKKEPTSKSMNPPSNETSVQGKLCNRKDERMVEPEPGLTWAKEMRLGGGREEAATAAQKKKVMSHMVSQLATPGPSKAEANASECDEFDDFFNKYMHFP